MKKLLRYSIAAAAVWTGTLLSPSAFTAMAAEQADGALPTVAYVYNSTYSTYCGLDSDPLYQALSKAGKYEVTAYDVNGKAATDYTELQHYGLVISTEANGGTNAFGLQLKNLVGQVPMINFKTFYFGSGRWDWGTSSNPSPKTSVLTVSDRTLKLYEGVLFDGSDAALYTPNSAFNQLQGSTVAGGDVATLAEVSGYQAIFTKGGNFIHIGYSYDDIMELNHNGVRIVLNAADILLDENTDFGTKSSLPQIYDIAIDGEAVSAAFLGDLSDGEALVKLEEIPNAWPVVSAEATVGGSVEVTQPTLEAPVARIVLKDAAGTTISAYSIGFTTTPPAEKHAFDFVVGVDGDMDAAIAAANKHDNSKRFHIFVPDGTYKLTGNTTITPGKEINDSTGVASDPGTINNGMTHIKRNNVSIIGQSRDGAVIYNEPLYCGISYTSTIEFRGTECYMQDLSVKNMYAYGRHDRGVGVAYYDRGQKNVLKNVLLWCNQDTYVSAGTRGYYEDCEIAGTVDFICGSGDYYFKNCLLTINNRSGNVICAPRTNASEQWGYVFDHCTIDKAAGATAVKNKNWTLGRPWNNSPAATYLYTTMKVLPSDAGWAKMSADKVCRFHEYGSVDASGKSISLSKRSISACSPATGSDDPVLTAAAAATYTLENVLGGEDGFDPTLLTAQVAAPEVSVQENTLLWEDSSNASCYVIFKDGKYLANQTATTFHVDEAGVYTVRAANARGGLGAASNAVTVTPSAIETVVGDFSRRPSDKVVYDLAGRAVTTMTAGFYIVGGKKVVVK